MSKPFCAVVALKDRLSVVGSSELLASVLPKHSPSSLLPGVWQGGAGSRWGILFERRPTGRIVVMGAWVPK